MKRVKGTPDSRSKGTIVKPGEAGWEEYKKTKEVDPKTGGYEVEKVGTFRIPNYIAIKRDLIARLNAFDEKTNKGPHIRIVNNPSASHPEFSNQRLLVSDYLKIAIEQVRRGRVSREQVPFMNKLLIHYNDVFANEPFFKTQLRISLEGVKGVKSSSGTYYISRMILVDPTYDGYDPLSHPDYPTTIYPFGRFPTLPNPDPDDPEPIKVKWKEMSDSQKNEYLVIMFGKNRLTKS